MRRTKAAWVLGAALALVAGRATAAEGKNDPSSKGSKGTEEAAPQEPSTVTPDSTIPLQRSVDTSKKTEQTKPWEIGVSFETHRMFVQDDLEGSGSSKVFNAYGLYAYYRFTDHDTLGISEFISEGFIADPGEPATQGSDPVLKYSHSVSLPRDFIFVAGLSLGAPVSISSQKAGLITAPGLSLSLSKRFGRYLSVSAGVTGTIFIDRYAEQEGGGPNALARVGGALSAEVIMPFHEPLSFGFDVNDVYGWYYNVQSSDPGIVSPGVVADANYPNQPIFQQYGGEIYGRYTLPALAGAKSDFMVALGDGDPTFGMNSYLHDGVGYTYLFYRLSAEVYGALTIRY